MDERVEEKRGGDEGMRETAGAFSPLTPDQRDQSLWNPTFALRASFYRERADGEVPSVLLYRLGLWVIGPLRG